MRPIGRKLNTVRKGDRTRQMILEKAAPVFNRKGYSGTALADLMEATGLQKGGIYRHFGSKEELAADAFDYAWSTVSGSRFAMPGKGLTGLERLRAIVLGFGERPSDIMPGGCPLLNTAVEADDTNTILRARARTALSEWKKRLEKAVVEAVDARQLRHDTDPGQVAVVVISALEGALMMSRLERDRTALKQAKEHLLWFLDSLGS